MTRDDASATPVRARIRRLPVLLLAAAGLLAGPARAGLVVERLDVTRVHGVYYLSGRLVIDPGRTLRRALLHGIPVTLDLKIRIVDRDAFLWWGTVAQIHQRYRIAYHTVLGRYTVHNLETGVRTSYPSWARVRAALERPRGIPLVDRSLLKPRARYRVRVRLELHVDDIPHALRWIAGLWTNWKSRGPWTSVPLAP